MRKVPAALLVLACLVTAGCLGSASTVSPIDPTEDSDYVSGRTIHLKMQVVDYDQELYPGLTSWLWAFCVEPFDASDAASAAAIEYMDRLPGDGTNQPEAGIRDHCGVPGPTIRVQQGDRVIVEFSNQHFHPHTIHWHGQYVPEEMDGAQGVSQQAVPKGGSFTYDFIAKRAGTLWYHCHVDAGFHVMQGLYGMFIVEPHSKTHEPKDVDHEEKLILSTVRRATVEAVPGTSRHNHPPGCFVSGTPDCQNGPQDLTPDTFLINGHSYPLTEEQPQSYLHIAEGKTIRVRILNAGNTIEELHLHGHDMQVIAEDGIALAVPYSVDTLRVGPAERYDVLIKGTNPGVWLMHTHVSNHETNDLQFPGGMHTMLVYDGYEDKMHAFPAEKAGGFPYYADAYPPTDLSFADTVFVPGAAGAPVPGAPPQAQGVSESRTFSLDMACAAKTLDFTAQLHGATAGVSSAQLQVTLKDPTGTVRASGTLGLNQADPQKPIVSLPFHASQNETSVGVFTLPAGNWTVAVTGSGAQVAIGLSAGIDYYASWDEQRESHHAHKTPLCGTWGYGSGGRTVGAPPI